MSQEKLNTDLEIFDLRRNGNPNEMYETQERVKQKLHLARLVADKGLGILENLYNAGIVGRYQK